MGENVHLARAVAWLAEVGGSAAPGELGAALGVGHTTQAKVTQALRDARLVQGGKDRIALTPAGWARATAGDAPATGGALEAAARWEHIGAYAHAAFLRLLCSAVVARHHLAGDRPRGHLGFMAIGETGTGKTSPVDLAAYLFGLDTAAVKRFLYTETPGSLFGRRERDGEGYRLVPSEAASLPLLLLDEFDKADRAAHTMGWAFFQGETAAQHEGQAWPVRPVPVLTANQPDSGNRYRLLRQEYRRRCVVLDTGYMRGRGDAIEDMLTAYYRTARPGELSLDQLRPPADRLGDDGLAVLRLARGALTEAGRAEFPGVDALELATLGRLALTGAADHQAAAYATGLDYLLATETVPGQAAEGWQLDLAAVRKQLGEEAAGPLAVAVEAARAGRARAAHHARAQVADREKLADDLTRSRDALAERLRLASVALQPRKLGPLSDALKADAGGVRGLLRKLRAEVQACRSAVRLDELADRAAGPLADAERIVCEVAAELDRRDRARQEAAQQRQDAARSAAAARRLQVTQRRGITAARRQELGQVTDQAQQIERLYRRTSTREDERPLYVLHSRGLMAYVPRPPAPRPEGRMARIRHALKDEPRGDWYVKGTAVSFPGWPGACPALAQWGDGTRAALAPVLAILHAREDQLRAELGRVPRRGRPLLDGGRPALTAAR